MDTLRVAGRDAEHQRNAVLHNVEAMDREHFNAVAVRLRSLCDGGNNPIDERALPALADRGRVYVQTKNTLGAALA